MKRLHGKLTYSNVVSTSCLPLLVGGGTAWAATTQLPKNSVGAKQIKKGAVTPEKLNAAAKSGMTGPRGLEGPRGAEGLRGPDGPRGEQGEKGEKVTPARRRPRSSPRSKKTGPSTPRAER